MRGWLFLLSGLIIWAAHFFALYVAASLFPGMRLANVVSIALTVLAMAGAGWFLWQGRRSVQAHGGDRLSGWLADVSVTGNAIALVAIAYQAVPALLL